MLFRSSSNTTCKGRWRYLASTRWTSSVWRTSGWVLLGSALILALSLGVRHGFGLFLPPMSAQFGWGREVFAFAIALQNLIWGLAQPFTGALADRFGAAKVVIVGGVLYAVGLVLMGMSDSLLTLSLSAGLLIGIGLSGTSFSVILGVVGRALPPEKRSMGRVFVRVQQVLHRVQIEAQCTDVGRDQGTGRHGAAVDQHMPLVGGHQHRRQPAGAHIPRVAEDAPRRGAIIPAVHDAGTGRAGRHVIDCAGRRRCGAGRRAGCGGIGAVRRPAGGQQHAHTQCGEYAAHHSRSSGAARGGRG